MSMASTFDVTRVEKPVFYRRVLEASPARDSGDLAPHPSTFPSPDIALESAATLQTYPGDSLWQ